MDLEQHFVDLNDLMNLEKETEKPEQKIECCSLRENYEMSDGMITCKCCHNTINNISDNPEWRFYGSNDTKSSDPTRCGIPINTLLPESSVGSTISYSSNSKTMNQIRKFQQWNGMPYKERSLYKVFLRINETCQKNGLPRIISNEANSLYTIVSATKISRGKNRNGIIAACVYFACKSCEVPRSSKEIAGFFEITVPVMSRGIKKTQEIIYMDKTNKDRLFDSESIQPNDFIDRFCNKLSIDETNKKEIYQLCKNVLSSNIISENTPPSIAAGCVFYISKKNSLPITKKQISEVSKISEVTINKCCKKLESNEDLFVE